MCSCRVPCRESGAPPVMLSARGQQVRDDGSVLTLVFENPTAGLTLFSLGNRKLQSLVKGQRSQAVRNANYVMQEVALVTVMCIYIL